VTHAAVFSRLAWAAAILAFLQISLGGAVRVSGSGLGCPDWPLCQGRLLPPFETHALVEYSHRLVGSLTGLAIVATVAMAWAWYGRSRPLVAWLASGAVLAVVLEGVLGGVVVLRDLASWLVVLHMALALVILGLLVATAVAASPSSAPGSHPGRRRLAAAAALTFLLILTGSSVVASGADHLCRSWPLCGGGGAADFSGAAAFVMLHRLGTGLVGLVVVAVLAEQALHANGGRRTAAVLTLLAFLAQVVVGAGSALTGTALFNGLHVALATAVWSGLVACWALAGGVPAAQPRRLVELKEVRA